jgi:CheY-like chemotaxis protein
MVDPAAAGGEALPCAAAPFTDALCAEVSAGLQGMLAVAELIHRNPRGADNSGYLDALTDCGHTLLRLVADAAVLSRAASWTPAPKPLRLRDLLDAVQANWSERAAGTGVALGAMFSGDAALTVELDGARLQQVYDLLLGHALEVTRRGGVEVGLRVERDGDRVRVFGEVRNTGRSIDPAHLPTLFNPFDAAGHAAYGTGLGLALARQIVTTLGGRIWAGNNAGLGSTVGFQLEARACEATSGADDRGEGASGPPTLSGHILVVDDNATNRIVARHLVELFGCSCETANDGAAAVDLVSRSRFDAVLMDIRMPLMDGIAAARAIRCLPQPRSGVPIIALTANADPEDARAYRAAGMTDLVEKPIKPERLLQALGDALAGKVVDSTQAAA